MNILKANLFGKTYKIITVVFQKKSIFTNQSIRHSFCSQKYRKTSFNWQPAPNNKNPSYNQNHNQNPQYQQRRKDSGFHSRQNNRTNKPISNTNRDDKVGQQKQKKPHTLNPSMSILSQMMYKKTLSELCGFYEENKEFFTPRILVSAARQFCILLDKEKNSHSFSSSSTISLIHKFISSVLSLESKLKTEQIWRDEAKNLLFFVKKLEFDLAKVIHMEKGSQYFDEELYQELTNFRNQLLFILLDPSYDYSDYEIHELVEIFHGLIRFSELFEVENLYKCILEKEQLINETINSQYLFSATNFLITVKNIEFNAERGVERRNFQTEEKVPWAKSFLSKKSLDERKRTKILREKCYEIFFNKWKYYFEDMTDYIVLNDALKIWPGIILSNSGPKMLLKDKNGPQVLKTLEKILKNNGSKFEEMMKIHTRVLANSMVVLSVISKRHSSDKLSQELERRGNELICSFGVEERKKVKIRAQYFTNLLKQEHIISTEEEIQTIEYLNLF